MKQMCSYADLTTGFI